MQAWRYSKARLLTVTDLKDMAYCPVIPWIRWNLGYTEPPTPSMETGRARAGPDYKEAVAEELGLPRPYRLEVPLKSERLGLAGVVDVVAGEPPYTVVEVKAYRRTRGRWSHYRLQLLAYTLLVMDTMGPVREAILYMPGEAHRIPVNERTVEETLKAIERLRRITEASEPPPVTPTPAKCAYCGYNKVCPVRPYIPPTTARRR
ncbi:CRISPR-associated protein Cas4 [Stetteria hydrogenophila]